MLSKALIQFSVEGQGYVPSLFFDLKPNYGGGDADSGDLLQKAPCTHCYTQGPHPSSRPPSTHASAETPGHSRASLGQALVGSLLLPLGPGAHRVLFVASQSLFPRPVYVLAALWWVNGDLLQEGFCHAQVHCTQRPCPCGGPLPTHTSSGDSQTQLCLRFCSIINWPNFSIVVSWGISRTKERRLGNSQSMEESEHTHLLIIFAISYSHGSRYPQTSIP